MPTRRLLTVNLASTLAPVRLTLNAVEYLVAPCVMVVQGVLNGGYLPDTAIVPDAWNGMPIVCGHPLDAAGVAMSATTPGVPHLGAVRRPRLGAGQRAGVACASLVAELWLDIVATLAIGGEAAQALAMLESQQPLEVSTAFYPETTRQVGSWHGTPYHEVYTSIDPDHLALLPNGIGACSWTNGNCGAPRLNEHGGCQCSTCHTERSVMDPDRPGLLARLRQFLQGEETPPAHPPESARKALVGADGKLRDRMTGALLPENDPLYAHLVTEQTDADVREALYSVIAREQGRSVSDVFLSDIDRLTQTFVYRQGERLLQRHWTLDAAGVLALDPDVVEVQRSTTFLPVGTPGPVPVPRPAMFTEETSPMAATAAVVALASALITHAQTGWAETDRPWLESQPEAALTRLTALSVAPTAQAAAEPAPQTLDETVARFPVLARLVRQEQARKGAVIALLVANKGCPFTPEKLQTLELEELEGLIALASGGASYAGQGLPYERPVLPTGPPEPPDTLAEVVKLQRANGQRV